MRSALPGSKAHCRLFGRHWSADNRQPVPFELDYRGPFSRLDSDRDQTPPRSQSIFSFAMASANPQNVIRRYVHELAVQVLNNGQRVEGVIADGMQETGHHR